MQIVVSAKNQTIFDIAVQYYGKVAMFVKVLDLNPDLTNDYADGHDATVFNLAYPITEGTPIFIDPQWVDAKIARELKNTEVISFDKNDLL